MKMKKTLITTILVTLALPCLAGAKVPSLAEFKKARKTSFMRTAPNKNPLNAIYKTHHNAKVEMRAISQKAISKLTSIGDTTGKTRLLTRRSEQAIRMVRGERTRLTRAYNIRKQRTADKKTDYIQAITKITTTTSATIANEPSLLARELGVVEYTQHASFTGR
jgi:hypothetical protein